MIHEPFINHIDRKINYMFFILYLKNTVIFLWIFKDELNRFKDPKQNFQLQLFRIAQKKHCRKWVIKGDVNNQADENISLHLMWSKSNAEATSKE